MTGSRDGLVKVWDPRQKGEPVATMEPGEGETKRDCWTVAFGKNILKCSCGTTPGLVAYKPEEILDSVDSIALYCEAFRR